MKGQKEKEPLTIEQRIEQLKAQQEQAKEVFVKCQGAIEVLEQIKQEERDKWFREEMERRSAPSYPVDDDKDDVESADET